MTTELVGDHVPEAADGPLTRVRAALRAQRILSFYREGEGEPVPGMASGDPAGDGPRLVALHPSGGQPATICWVSALGAYLVSVPRGDDGADTVTAPTEQETAEVLACLWGVKPAPEQAAERLRELERLLAGRRVSARIVDGEEIRLEVDGPATAVVPVKVAVGGRGGAYLVYIGSGAGAHMVMARQPGEAARFVIRGMKRGADASFD